MDKRKVEWMANYIKLNLCRTGLRMILDEEGRERDDSVVMTSSEYDLKVAIRCEHHVCIKHICIFEGNSDYYISKDYFDMSKFKQKSPLK